MVIKRYDKSGKFIHSDLPDIEKEAFKYLNKRIELLEKLLEEKHVVSSENLDEIHKKRNKNEINFDLLDDYFIDGAGI